MPRRLMAGSLLAAVMAIALGVRLAQVRDSLWLDELHTAWCVDGSFGETAARAQIGNQSPCYFYLPQLLVASRGMTESSLRLPSVTAGVLLIPLAFGLMWRWSRSMLAATTLALLVAVDHDCIFYAQEARPYACVQLIGMIQMGLFWWVLRHPQIRWRAAWIVATGAMFHLHYTSVLLVSGELVYYAILKWSSPRWAEYAPRQLALDLLALVVITCPAWPQVLEIAGRRHNWSLFVAQAPATGLLTLYPFWIYLWLPLGGMCLSRWIAGRDRRGAFPWDVVLLLVFCFAVPMVLTWTLTALDVARLFLVRYLVVVAVAPMLVCGLLIGACPHRIARWLVAVIVLGAALQDSGIVQQFQRDGRLLGDRNQDWRGAVQHVRRDAEHASWPVLVRSGLLEADRLKEQDNAFLRSYCLSPVTSIYRLDDGRRELIPLPTVAAGELNDVSLATVFSSGGAWFLINGSRRSRVQTERDAVRAITAQGWRADVAERRDFGDLWIVRVAVENVSR